MSVQLLGKRELKRLASVANDGAGAGYSGFAKGMMAKMGWAEGQGLGKDMQGRATYVQVKKKDDNAGLGKEKAQQNNVNDQWYFDAFDSALANMGGKKKDKKGKKAKRNKKAKTDGGEVEAADAKAGGGMSMYDKMFKATGGARMGMRARASQNGKLARTEGGKDGAGGSLSAASNGAIKSEESGKGSTGHKRKRAVGMGDEAPGQDAADRVEGVVVKKEKNRGEGKVVADKGVKQEAEAPGASTKAERKRDRSASKKAKRADKAAKEEEKEDKEQDTLVGGSESGVRDVEGGAPAASKTGGEKARRKKERKAKKRARKEA